VLPLPTSVPEEDEPEEDDELFDLVGVVWLLPVSGTVAADEQAATAIAMQLANTQIPARFVAIGPIDPSAPRGRGGAEA
jgi:hypothetical protein